MYEKKKKLVYILIYKIEFCLFVYNLIIIFRRYINKLVNKYFQCLYVNKFLSFKIGNLIMFYIYVWMKKNKIKWDGFE